jgi:hypothetical protein
MEGIEVISYRANYHIDQVAAAAGLRERASDRSSIGVIVAIFPLSSFFSSAISLFSSSDVP